MDCPFCSIVAGDERAHELCRDEDAVAFLDVYPAARGHTLVVPTTHHEELPDMTGDEAGALFRAVRNVATGLTEAMDADGVSIFQSSGAAAGQDVFHVHVHVIPRFVDDDIRFAPSRTELSAAEGEAIVDALRPHLPG